MDKSINYSRVRVNLSSTALGKENSETFSETSQVAIEKESSDSTKTTACVYSLLLFKMLQDML